GGADLVGGNGDDIVQRVFQDGEGGVAGLFHGHAVGEDADFIEGHRAAGGQRGLHRGGVLGFDTDDLDIGAQEFGVGGDAGGQPAPADGDVDRGDGAAMLAQDFDGDGALAGDDLEIVIGVDEGEVLGL